MDESWGEDEDGDDLLLASAVDGAASAVRGRLATGNNLTVILHRFPPFFEQSMLGSSVADPDPGSGAFLTPGPGSGIRNRFFPDPGSQNHIFKSLMTIFCIKSSIIL